jgi:hypothetical protein
MRLMRIDDLTRRDHYYIGAGDACYYFGEYTSRKGTAYSIASSLVHDLLELRDPAIPKQEFRKDRALSRVAQWIGGVFDPQSLPLATFVPLPQSGSGILTDNDDRMLRILKRSAEGLDIRRMLELVKGGALLDVGSVRSGPDVLYESMRVVLPLTDPKPHAIFLVDDVLTTGANFVAAKRRLAQVLPDVPVYGLFVARKTLDSGSILGR